MAWDLEATTAEGSSSGQEKNYTKFEQGVTFIQLIDKVPFVRWTHWIPKHNRSVTCAGRGCAICEVRAKEKANKVKQYTFSTSKRFAINVYNHDTKQVEIMEQGKTFFEDMKLIIDEQTKDRDDVDDYGQVVGTIPAKKYEELVFKVTRTGQKTDTKYRVDFARLGKVDEAWNPTDLADFYKPLTVEQSIQVAQGANPADVFKSEEPVEAPQPTEPEEFEFK